MNDGNIKMFGGFVCVTYCIFQIATFRSAYFLGSES